ncbi:glycoside hydrolase family 3 C-terminal domain-containing protein [Microbispora sp. ATCC PTA-5024]|uniref:glycoside hydrolase family 3 C-terminal domain-containing protein n=1 Tax=Microbispora sp. ATCC PTA-5024 TaxID=316330 RepID=UPI0003DC8499|nr:glycoside hydrolase family 3 C-terminal domain-containing protein [Microbispora sp. ATCC PTA-5024]ETK37288.1 beta-glucosidase [Microbispora sp. ATCC PTA-5024]
MNDDELDHLVEKLDLDRKVRLLDGATVWRLHAEPAVGLRPIVTSDGPAGVRGEGWDERRTSVLLPSPTALAATWDEDLLTRLGGLLAAEARRKGVDVVLAPALNLQRSAFGGRHFECYSEDPVLTARVGAALIRGVQAGGVAATAKHYVANDSETERLTLDARVDERTLRELYLVPFEAAVEAGVWVVMSAYNQVNGHTMSESPLLAEPLKGEWGFDGVVVSDWGAVRSTAASGRAAQDLAMPGPNEHWGEALARAVRAGEVPEAAVDDKVRRLLRLAARVGALSPATAGTAQDADSADPATGGGHGHEDARALVRRTAAAGSVLLRNEGGLLPLDPARLRRVAVLGPNAATARVQGGGSAGVYPEVVVSPLEGVRAALAGRAEVVHTPGAHIDDRPTPLGLTGVCDPRDGRPGVLVRLLDGHGEEIHAEHRLSGRILEPALVRGARAVEIAARLRPATGGAWRLSVAGWGHVRLTVDGRMVLDEEVVRDTDDPATVHLHPPYRTAEVDLEAGREVEVVAWRRLDRDSGRASALAADPPRGRDEDAELAAAAALARECDAAIVVVGTTEEIESEGADRDSLALPGRQDDLVRAVAAANPSTVVAVNSGGPVALPWRDEVAAILLGWFPGQEAGHALADVLFGRAEPGGRLPTTWAGTAIAGTTPVDGVLEYAEGLHIGYRAWLRRDDAPAYWFGHGLGYTEWAYESLDTPGRVEPGRPFTATVRVRNAGARRGGEVVQVYLSRPESALDRPERWLAGFARIEADPDETVEVAVTVPARATRHWSVEERGWRTEPGTFEVHAGRSAVDLPLRAAVVVAPVGPGAPGALPTSGTTPGTAPGEG